MDSKHTPGPWIYDSEIPAIIAPNCPAWDDGGETDFDLKAPPTEVVNLYGAMGGKDTKADSFLLAAAPDLLEALKWMESKAPSWNGGVLAHPQVLKDARAAIAKAEGQVS